MSQIQPHHQQLESNRIHDEVTGMAGWHSAGSPVRVRFYLEQVDTGERTSDGMTKWDPIEMIEVRMLHDSQTKVRRRVQPIDRVNYAATYREWKEGGDIDVVDGTPLAELPGIAASMVQRFTAWGVTSIEDATTMSEEKVANIGNGAAQVREQARLWIDQRNKGKKQISSAKEIADLKGQRDELTRALEEARDALRRAEARADAFQTLQTQVRAASKLVGGDPSMLLQATSGESGTSAVVIDDTDEGGDPAAGLDAMVTGAGGEYDPAGERHDPLEAALNGNGRA